MVQYLCADKKVEETFGMLCQLITDNGGFIHEELIIEQKERSVTVRVPSSVEDNAIIIKLPRPLLLPYAKFNIDIQDNQYILNDCDESITPLQRELMEHMLALYNLTDKFAEHREISILQLIHKDPDVIKWILGARDPASRLLIDDMGRQDFEDTLKKSFFKTRVIGIRSEDPDVSEKEQCLMPLVDFINHHFKANIFNLPADMHSDLTIMKSTPVDGSDECYVRYSNLDALDSLLNYDFPDEHALFVRSVPLKVELENVGVCEIKSNLSHVKHDVAQLPGALKGLGMYLPQIAANDVTKTFELSFLMIPQAGAPKSMRRILAAGLGMIAPTASPDQVLGYVAALEKQVIRHNIIFYNDLREKLDNHQRVVGCEVLYDRIYQMIDFQIGNIRKYPLIETIDVSDLLNEK